MIRATDILLISFIHIRSLVNSPLFVADDFQIQRSTKYFFFLHPRNLKNLEIIFRVKD